MAVQPDEIEQHWIWPLVEQGLTVFPLGAVGERPPAWAIDRADGDLEKAGALWPKQPRAAWKQWQSARPSDAQVAQWIMQAPECNFAIATGKEIDVIDADDADAIEWVKNNLTRTPWMVKTGKGAHFYYQTNEKITIKNSADVDAKLDIRGAGGYVVAPGSLHNNGKRYQLEIDPAFPVDSIRDLPCITADDLEKIAQFKRGSVQDIGGAAGNLAGFDAAQFAPAVSSGVREGGRNQNLTRLVGGWIRDGYNLTQVLARAMQTNMGNSPPLPQQEVVAIVQSLIATHASNHAEELANATVQEAPKAAGLLLKPSELLTNAPAWLIKDIMPADGIGCLFGPSGGGKSFAVIDLMLHVAAGRDWHGRQTRKPGSVLYVCGEGLSGISNRLRAWEKHTGIDLNNLPLRVTRQPVMFMDPASVNALMEAIKDALPDLGDVSLLVIDTLNRNFGDGDENTTKDMTRFINALTEIQKVLNTTVLVVHHTGLGDGERARGSSALRAALDFEIQQKVIEGDDPGFCLVGKKMKDGSQIPDSHFSLAFVPLGHDDQGDEFGSCVIEPMARDQVSAARTADALMDGPRQEKLLAILREMRAQILANKPDIEQVVVEKSSLNAAMKARGIPHNKTTEIQEKFVGKGLLFPLSKVAFAISKQVEKQ